jgi:hypothetical protein
MLINLDELNNDPTFRPSQRHWFMMVRSAGIGESSAGRSVQLLWDNSGTLRSVNYFYFSQTFQLYLFLFPYSMHTMFEYKFLKIVSHHIMSPKV